MAWGVTDGSYSAIVAEREKKEAQERERQKKQKEEAVVIEAKSEPCIKVIYPHRYEVIVSMLEIKKRGDDGFFVICDPMYSDAVEYEGEAAASFLRKFSKLLMIGLPTGVVQWTRIVVKGRWPNITLRINPQSPPVSRPSGSYGWPGAEDF